jgi:hypothetical protein
LRRYRDGGASAIANQRRGCPSNNRLPDVVRDHAIALVREAARYCAAPLTTTHARRFTPVGYSNTSYSKAAPSGSSMPE